MLDARLCWLQNSEQWFLSRPDGILPAQRPQSSRVVVDSGKVWLTQVSLIYGNHKPLSPVLRAIWNVAIARTGSPASHIWSRGGDWTGHCEEAICYVNFLPVSSVHLEAHPAAVLDLLPLLRLGFKCLPPLSTIPFRLGHQEEEKKPHEQEPKSPAEIQQVSPNGKVHSYRSAEHTYMQTHTQVHIPMCIYRHTCTNTQHETS